MPERFAGNHQHFILAMSCRTRTTIRMIRTNPIFGLEDSQRVERVLLAGEAAKPLVYKRSIYRCSLLSSAILRFMRPILAESD